MTQSNDAGIWIALDVMTTIETLIQMKIHTTVSLQNREGINIKLIGPNASFCLPS